MKENVFIGALTLILAGAVLIYLNYRRKSRKA